MISGIMISDVRAYRVVDWNDNFTAFVCTLEYKYVSKTKLVHCNAVIQIQQT